MVVDHQLKTITFTLLNRLINTGKNLFVRDIICFKISKGNGQPDAFKTQLFEQVEVAVFNISLSKSRLFQVCSRAETLMPLSKLLARLNASARAFWGFGLLFAIVQLIIIIIATIAQIIWPEKKALLHKFLIYQKSFTTKLNYITIILSKTNNVCSNY
jgi:hypothetical protein